jgi:hypothetical protein
MEHTVNLVGINISDSDMNDISLLFKEKSICLVSFQKENFLPDAIGVIIIQLAQCIPYNIMYDTMKYILLKIISKIKLTSNQGTLISIKTNDRHSEISLSFDLTDKQKNKMVDAVIQKLLDD